MAEVNIPSIVIDERIDAGIEHQMEVYLAGNPDPPIGDRVEYIRSLVINMMEGWAQVVENNKIAEGMADPVKRQAILDAAAADP